MAVAAVGADCKIWPNDRQQSLKSGNQHDGCGGDGIMGSWCWWWQQWGKIVNKHSNDRQQSTKSSSGNSGCGNGGNICSSGSVGNYMQQHAVVCGGDVWKGVRQQQRQCAQQAIARCAVKNCI
jgi:hypothetical protein